MPHPLQRRIRTIGYLARGLMIVQAILLIVGVTVVAGFCLGLLDYAFRFREPSVRWICSGAWLLAVASAGCLFLWPVLRRRLSNLAIAQHVQRRYPHLRDRLTSTVEFLEQPESDPTAGSAAMRRAVVAETTAVTEPLDFSAVLDWRWTVAIATVVGSLSVTCLAISMLDYRSAWQAGQRLALPFVTAPWPRKNNLQFEQPPERISKGEDVLLKVTDLNRRMPTVVKLHYRLDNERQIKRPIMTPRGEAMVLRLNNLTQSLDYRAVGGDDETPWRRLEVREPPRLVSLQVTLVPPKYTQWPARTSQGDIRALEGTRVELTAESSTPLKSVEVRFDDEITADTAVQLSDDGRRIVASGDPDKPWLVTSSGHYWLELVDRSGIPGGGDSPWEILAIADEPPSVLLEKPTDNIFATPLASVPLQAIVKDDLAIEMIELRYSRSDQSERGEQSILLYRGEELPSGTDPDDVASGQQRGQGERVHYSWELSKLAGLDPGDAITFFLVAGDYKPQIGRTESLRLSIISPDELEDLVARRQSGLLAQLDEVVTRQESARTQTRSLQERTADEEPLGRTDLHLLQSAELNQRQVQRLLFDLRDGLQASIEALLADLRNNRVDNPGIYRRLDSLRDAVRQLGTRELPTIERELIEALKTARAHWQRRQDDQSPLEAASGTAAADVAVARSIAAAGNGQDDVISALLRMRRELAQWDNYRRFGRELSQLRREQQQLQQQAGQLGTTTVGQDVRSLTTSQRSNLQLLAQRQYELGRRFDRILSRMQQMSDKLRLSDPLASDTLNDAVETAHRNALSGRLRQCGDGIAQNRIGQTNQLQDEVIDDLAELLDILSGRREHELTRLVEKLRQAADQLDELRRSEEELRKQLQQAAHNADGEQRRNRLEKLAKRQQELADEARRISRQLLRLQAQRAAQATSQGAARLDKSSRSSRQDQGDDALQHAGEAGNDLENARQELAQEIARAEQELLSEQLARLEQTIEGLLRRQQSLQQRTDELDQLRDADGRLGRAQLSTLGDMARQQRDLARETESLATQLAKAEAFELGLRGASREMLRAAAALGRQRTGPQAQQPQQHATIRLNQLVEALRSDPPQQPQAGSAGRPGGGDQTTPPSSEAIRALAELKLLKLMQQEIRRRTTQLQPQRGAGSSWTDQQEQEMAELALEQGRLAEIIFNLSTPAVRDPEDDPENLPDLRQQPK